MFAKRLVVLFFNLLNLNLYLCVLCTVYDIYGMILQSDEQNPMTFGLGQILPAFICSMQQDNKLVFNMRPYHVAAVVAVLLTAVVSPTATTKCLGTYSCRV
jgi:hypothetical protein